VTFGVEDTILIGSHGHVNVKKFSLIDDDDDDSQMTKYILNKSEREILGEYQFIVSRNTEDNIRY
jgi:hypothetical protein